MAKHPTSSRVHREDQVPDDAFVSGVKRVVTWSRTNSRLLTIAGVVVAAAVIVTLYVLSSQRQIEAQATARLGQVQQSVASGNVQLAIRDLQSYLASFGDADAAAPARLILAELLIRQDRADEAVQALGDLPEDLDGPTGLAAARLEAAAYEELGQADQAVDLYTRIADRARFDFQRREALADAARVRFQNGDPDGAARLYQRVLDSFEDQEAGRGYYEMWLAEARAQAEEGQGTTPTQPADSAPDTAGTPDNG
jgi:predicted negative regulator of RcsB-dependent stress response